MGGKKPIGEHPSRGHLQRRFTSISRRGGHTHRTYDPASDENEYHNVPVIQEFSLFSEFDISPDRFGILSNKISTEKEEEDNELKNGKVEAVSPFQSGITDNIFYTPQGSSSTAHHHPSAATSSPTSQTLPPPQLEMLQMTVYHLTAALERLEFQFYAAMNNLYCYGLPLQQHIPQQEPSQTPTPSTFTSNDETNGNLIKKINERLSTLEGRQKIIQGKISQLDNLYGQTAQAWGKSIREMLKGNIAQFPIPTNIPEVKEEMEIPKVSPLSDQAQKAVITTNDSTNTEPHSAVNLSKELPQPRSSNSGKNCQEFSPLKHNISSPTSTSLGVP